MAVWDSQSGQSNDCVGSWADAIGALSLPKSLPHAAVSASNKSVWDVPIGTTSGKRSTKKLELPVKAFGATKADSLTNTLRGVQGGESVRYRPKDASPKGICRR